MVLLSWLFVVLLPAFVLLNALDYFFAMRLEQSITRIKPILQTEMRFFFRDLDETVWLQKKLQKFDEANGYVDHTTPQAPVATSAAEIRRRLRAHTGLPVLAVFSHGVDTLHADFSVNEFLDHDLPRPIIFFLRKFLSLMSNQWDKGLVHPEHFKPAFSDQQRVTASRTRHTYFREFLKNYFSMILPVNISPRTVTPSISSRIGDTGKVLFYYGSAVQSSGSLQYNMGGYFAVFRVADIPELKLVKEVCNDRFNDSLKRTIGTVRAGYTFPDSFKNIGLGGYRQYKDRLALQAVIPESLILRLVQSGGIIPKNLHLFAGQMPCLEVSCSIEELGHPLQRHEALIKFLIKLFSLAGTLIFIRLLLFGYGAKITLAVKIALAVLFVCILPSVGFMLAVVAREDFAIAEADNSTQKALKSRISLVQNLIGQQMDTYELATQRLAQKLSEESVMSDAEHHVFFRNWAENKPVAGLLYKRLDRETMEFWADFYRQDSLFSSEREGKWFLMQSGAEYFLNAPFFSGKIKSKAALTEITGNYETVSYVLSADGKLLYMPRLSQTTRMSTCIAYQDDSEARIPLGILLVDYCRMRLSMEILGHIADKVSISEMSGAQQLEIAVALIGPSGPVLYNDLTSGGLQKAMITDLIKTAVELNGEIQQQFSREGYDHTVFVQLDQRLPIAILASMRQPQYSGEILQWRLPALYVLLLIALSLVLSRQMFIVPLLAFIRGLEEVAGGNLQFKMAIETGDEFEVMAVECNRMIQELSEKVMLEQYVSVEVLEEVRQTTEAQLKPGGERVDAAIVFATLDQVEKGHKGHPGVQLDFVGQFYEICHSICTSNGGMIDKVIGSTLMMVFRASESARDHNILACQAVFQIKNAVAELSRQRSLRFAAGINSGSVISGKIGSHTGKLDYTVIGDAVNLAARLKAHAAMFAEATIICSGSVAAFKSELFQIKPEAEIRIKGKAERIRIYRLTEL